MQCYSLFVFLDQDSGMTNAEKQNERPENDHDKAAGLKRGFRMLGADVFNDSKVIFCLKFE